MSSLLSFFPKESRIALNGEAASCREISDALLSPSLFGGEAVVVLEGGEKLGKKEQETLAECARIALTSGYLLSSVKTKVPFLSLFEKVGVVLDLLEEKPWEKEKRLIEEIHARVSASQKKIAPDAVSLLLEQLGPHLAFLDTEIDKLLCFVGEKKIIESSDISAISSFNEEESFWKIAEEIVWERTNPSIDASLFHGLILALRSQLQVGMKITELVDHKVPREEWGPFLPRLWPKLLEKRTSQALALGHAYFQRGLDLLFEIELLSRSSSSQEEALLDFYQFSIHDTYVR